MKIDVFYLNSDMHVRPVRFTVLCTPTDSSDKTQLMRSTILYSPGMTNLFAIAGHFVSYRSVIGPHNFLVML